MKKYFHFITQINGRDLTLKVIKSRNLFEWSYPIFNGLMKIFYHDSYDDREKLKDRDQMTIVSLTIPPRFDTI